MKPPLVQDHDFLCQSCGYVLTGLNRSDNCPECGTPVDASHPGSRPGSPWQQGESIPRSVFAVARHPRRVFQAVEPNIESSRVFKHVCVFGAGLATSLVIVLAYFIHRAVSIAPFSMTGFDRSVFLAVIAGAATLGVPISLVLAVLTEIERRGIMFFGKVHRRRIDASVAQTIVGHASALWFAVPLFMLIGAVLGNAIGWLAQNFRWATWELTLTAPVWMPALGAFCGMLAFEWTVWIGVQQLRYFNGPSTLASLNDHHASPQPDT